jgi:hypothetical protein
MNGFVRGKHCPVCNGSRKKKDCRQSVKPDGILYFCRSKDGIQLTRLEAYRAIELVGSSRDSETIWWAIEDAIAGGAS